MFTWPWQVIREKALYNRSARSFANYYTNLAAQYSQDATVLNEEINNIFSAIGINIENNNWPGIIKVVKSIADFLEAQGYWEELSHAYQDAIDAAERYFWRLFQNPKPEAWHDRIILRSDLGILLFRQGEYQKSKEIIQEALEIARRIEHQKLQALLISVLGNIAIIEAHFSQAEEYYSQCKEILEKLGDREGVANALGRLAILATSQGNRELAEQITKERLLLVREKADLDKEADAICELGDFALASGNHEEAEKLYDDSISIYQRTNNRSGVAWVLDRRASLLEKRGDLWGAHKVYQEKLDMASQMGVQDSILETLQSLASLSVDLKDLQNANFYYQQALQLSQDMGKLPDIAVALQGLANVAQLTGNNDDARSLFQKSLQIAYGCGYSKLINVALLQLSLFARKTEDYETAEKYLLEALSFLSGTTFHRDYARTLSDLGDVTAVLGKIVVARGHYQQAIEAFRNLGLPVESGFCLAQLSLIELWDENYDPAWCYLMQALNIFNQHKEDDLKDMIGRRLKNFQKIKAYQEQATELLEQVGNPDDDLNQEVKSG